MPKKRGFMITATYIVLNEADYLWASLESIYPVVDHIVIVEGATKFAVKEHVSPLGLSTDGTPQLIQAFKDNLDMAGKIKWIRVGQVETKKELRNRALEHVPSNTSIILKIDGDEMYLAKELEAAVKQMVEEQALMVRARHLMFWGSTHRVLKPLGDGNEWFVDVMYAYSPGMFYAGHVLPMIDTTTSFQDDPERILQLEDLNLFHFGWVRDKRKIVAKRWERLRQLQEGGMDVPHYRYLREKDDFGLYMEAISHCKAFNLANVDPATESIMPYKGPWPQPIIHHPFWKKEPKFFGVD